MTSLEDGRRLFAMCAADVLGMPIIRTISIFHLDGYLSIEQFSRGRKCEEARPAETTLIRQVFPQIPRS
ncbi:MAG: hypothetical protein ACE5OR_10570 [bacterium]